MKDGLRHPPDCFATFFATPTSATPPSSVFATSTPHGPRRPRRLRLGWHPHRLCKFLLDYEIGEEEYARRRKPRRYRWPDNVRDEVLARLLESNTERAAAETRAGAAA